MADNRFKEPITQLELLQTLHRRLASQPDCAGVLITSISLDEDAHWKFDIPPGVNAQCRSTILREQAAFRGRFELKDAPTTVALSARTMVAARGAATPTLTSPVVNGAPLNAGPIGGEPSEGAVGVGIAGNMAPEIPGTAVPFEAGPARSGEARWDEDRWADNAKAAPPTTAVNGTADQQVAPFGQIASASTVVGATAVQQMPDFSQVANATTGSDADTDAANGRAPLTIDASLTERADLTDAIDATVLRPIGPATQFGHWSAQARDVEAMARALAREFDHERERAEAQKSNAAPEQTTAYTEFLSRMAARLNELADAIHTAFVAPKKGEPIFTAPVQDALNAVGADFLRFVKEHRDDVYRISLFGGMAALLGWLNVADAAGFVSGMVLGTHASKDKKRS